VQPSGRSQDRDDLIAEHLPLARRLAARYGYTSEPLEDLVQVAATALVLAADRFDRSRGVTFASFAIPTIMGELKRHIRDHGWAARVPRSLQEDVLRVSAAADELGGRLGRSPSPRELAAETGMDVESVLEAMLAASAFESASLDGHVDDDDGRWDPPAAVLGVDERGYEQVERAVTLWPAVAELPDDERAVVALRFLGDLTQSDIARRIGVSQMQVSRLLRRALDRIHRTTGAAV